MIDVGGMRVTTWATLAVFVAVALARRDKRVLLAAAAWLTGFETAYQITNFLTGHPMEGWYGTPFLVIPGLVIVPWAWRAGIRPDGRVLFVLVVVWAVWVVDGFNANMKASGSGFDPWWELFNVAAKTSVAIAFLLPFVLAEAVDQRPDHAGGDHAQGDIAHGDLDRHQFTSSGGSSFGRSSFASRSTKTPSR